MAPLNRVGVGVSVGGTNAPALSRLAAVARQERSAGMPPSSGSAILGTRTDASILVSTVESAHDRLCDARVSVRTKREHIASETLVLAYAYAYAYAYVETFH